MEVEVSTGQSVECITVYVQKRRWQRLGITLERTHSQWPRVHSSTDTRFQIGDVVYMINGREAAGLVHTAKTIVWKRRMTITVLRNSHRNVTF